MNSKQSFIHMMLDRVRAYIDDPTLNAKYSNDFLLGNMITPEMVNVLSRINLTSGNPILLSFDVTLVKDQPRYVLPPNIGEVYRVGQLNTDGSIKYDFKPRSEFHGIGPVWAVDGNTINFRPYPSSNDAGEVITIFYIPNGDFQMHYSDDGGQMVSSTTFTLDQPLSGTSDIGYCDLREQAYSGALLRVFEHTNNTLIEERVIRSYDHNTFTATVDTAFTGNIHPSGSGSMNTTGYRYEVIPQMATSLASAISSAAAIQLGTVRSVSQKQMNFLILQHKTNMKSIMDNRSNIQNRVGKQYWKDTIDNVSNSWMR
tara:strand:- start:1241 stop:2182 length:942 start_codon:yes stop_codon:yes gene_type:complete